MKRRMLFVWTLSIVLAALYLGAGVSKIVLSEQFIAEWEKMGIGSFLPVVGALEIIGAVGVLIPGVAAAAAVGLAALMLIAAVITSMHAQYGSAIFAVIAMALCVMLAILRMRDLNLLGWRPFGSAK